MRNFTFYISGAHCLSCKIFIEDSLKNIGYIQSGFFDLKKGILKINATEKKDTNEVFNDVKKIIEPNGYIISKQRTKVIDQNSDEIWYAIPIGLTFVILFFLLQKSGLLNIGLGANITPITSFLIGLIASVSSCLAVVGGLVLSLSTKISQSNMNVSRTFFVFHLARILTFAILGGILGSIGRAIGINFTLSAILGIAASFIMIILGLNLIEVIKINKITLPSSIFNFFRNIKFSTATPIILGFATFFLPCGFTQSMQIAALSSGSFLTGLLIMTTFSFGTLPILAFLSFGSSRLSKNKYSKLFLKSAGVVVICFGLFAFLSGLASLGIINPIFNI